jgi:hypothetical protein
LLKRSIRDGERARHETTRGHRERDQADPRLLSCLAASLVRHVDLGPVRTSSSMRALAYVMKHLSIDVAIAKFQHPAPVAVLQTLAEIAGRELPAADHRPYRSRSQAPNQIAGGGGGARAAARSQEDDRVAADPQE